jgi:hypothetical protein
MHFVHSFRTLISIYFKDNLYKLSRMAVDYGVMKFESVRLQGEQVFPEGVNSPNISHVLKSLPGESGAWLVVEILRSRTISIDEARRVEDLAHQLNFRAAKSVSQAYAHNQLHFQHNFAKRIRRKKFISHKWLPVREIDSLETSIYFPAYTDSIPELTIMHADLQNSHFPVTYDFPDARIVIGKNISTFIGSDIFMDCNERVYLDNNSWLGARSHNLINDTMLMARSPKEVIIRSRNDVDITLPAAFWLGYPLMNAWGHWMQEGMMRIEIFSRHPDFIQVPVVIPDDVPEGFCETARLIYPSIRFLRYKNGSHLMTSRLYIAPSRTFHPHNVFWSKDDETLSLNVDPNIAIEFSKRVRSRVSIIKKSEGSPEFPSKVHLSRSNASYRASRNSELFSKLAEDNGFLSVDPGNLTSLEELFLFSGSSRLFGQAGSGFYLATVAKPNCQSLLVGSDFSHDWAGLAYAFKRCTEGDMNFVLGKRDFVGSGFSERLYHQDFTLSNNAVKRIKEFFLV